MDYIYTIKNRIKCVKKTDAFGIAAELKLGLKV